MPARQDRRRLPLQRWEIVHVVIERRELSVPRIAQYVIEPAVFGFAREEGNAQLLRLAHVARHLRQHGDAAGNVEAADADRHSSGKERPRKIDGARELVRLHADEADQRPAAFLADHVDDPVRPNAPIGFVVGVEADVDSGPEHLAPARILREAIQAGQGIGRYCRAHPLDRIAVVIVMRRLDHHEMEGSAVRGQRPASAPCSPRASPLHNWTEPSTERLRLRTDLVACHGGHARRPSPPAHPRRSAGPRAAN